MLPDKENQERLCARVASSGCSYAPRGLSTGEADRRTYCAPETREGRARFPVSCPAPAAGARGLVKMAILERSPATPTLVLVRLSPRLVWRVGLPGAPDCCHEHACQTR